MKDEKGTYVWKINKPFDGWKNILFTYVLYKGFTQI